MPSFILADFHNELFRIRANLDDRLLVVVVVVVQMPKVSAKSASLAATRREFWRPSAGCMCDKNLLRCLGNCFRREMARTIDPEHAHVACGLVASCVGINFVKRAPAAGAETLAHAGVPALRPAAGVGAQPLDRAHDRIELGPGGRSRAMLPQPGLGCFKIGEGFVGVAERARHAADRSASGVGDRQRFAGAQAIDPGSHLGGVDQSAGCHIGPRLGDALGFPGKAV